MTIDLTDSGGGAAHLMELAEVAKQLGTTVAAVEDLIANGRFPVPIVQVAGRTFVSRAKFDAWRATTADGDAS